MRSISPIYPTFVLPAPHGCNLSCPYCAVALRGEAKKTVLSSSQYLEFLDATFRLFYVRKVSIVGYEPTLPEAIELTLKILGKASEKGVSTTLITNGQNLPEHATNLAQVADTIMISLDSHDASRNDRLRGKSGAFGQALSGIESATLAFGAERVYVNSLLVANRTEYISGIPQLLSSLGVKKWIISPYICFNEGHLLSDIDMIRDAICALAYAADQCGIVTHFADEFGLIGEIDGVPILNFQRPGGSEALTYRLSPDGSCSFDSEILDDSSRAKVWNGDRSDEFLRSVLIGKVNVMDSAQSDPRKLEVVRT